MRRMNALDWVAWVLVIIGGLNWGLVGLFNLDVVATLFGAMSMVARVVYVLVGLSALYLLFASFLKTGEPDDMSRSRREERDDDDEEL